MDVFGLMKWALVLACLYAVFWEFMEAKRLSKYPKSYVWIKLSFMAVCLYWAFYYLRSALGLTIGSMHQIWVRAPLLITIMLIGASASLSWMRHRGDKL